MQSPTTAQIKKKSLNGSKRTSGIYDLDIKRMESAIKKLKPVVEKADPCFTSLSRGKLN